MVGISVHQNKNGRVTYQMHCTASMVNTERMMMLKKMTVQTCDIFRQSSLMTVVCLTTHRANWSATALMEINKGLRERTEHLDIFLFPPITQWCSISNFLFTGGMGVSDFSVLKYY